MDEIPLSLLLVVLVISILLSAFFSASETGLMTLNRYRLRHLVKTRHGGAARASKLLERPDRLLGLILIGNNFVNILASTITTLIALRFGGETALAVATGALTLIILVFGEVAPKTLAALHPERIAFPAAYIYVPLLKIVYPIVAFVNAIANAVLRAFGVQPGKGADTHLSREELRTVVNEAGALIPKRHQAMLLSILDLEKMTVDDIMVPRNDIVGIDLEHDIDSIKAQIDHIQHTRLPVYRGDINNIVGIVHIRHIAHLLAANHFNEQNLDSVIREPYFVPESTPLHTQLLNFQRNERRVGLVVDEYGDILGMVTLEDILEEIVGEFTSDPSTVSQEILLQDDGSYLVEGSAFVRDLNRLLGWKLPTNGPKTLSGLIVEHLETMPEPGTSIKIAYHPIEIVQTADNMVKTAKVYPVVKSA